MTSPPRNDPLNEVDELAKGGAAIHNDFKKEPDSGPEHWFSDEEQKRIIRRIDCRLIPIVGLMYCVSLIDRTNVAAASIAGMLEDLELIGNRYSIITLVFFTTYIVFQPPSTVIVRKIGPRIHLGSITLLWGAVMIGMGFTQKWEQLAALRVILGLLEAGFFPSCVYLLSTWYTRYEMGRRYAMFYAFGAVAGALAGIMAYGLVHMHGIANMGGWRWLFIVEGILTCVIALVGSWLLVDFPDSKRKSWRFLTDRERAWVVSRVDADRGDASATKFSVKKFASHALDFKVWAFGLLFFCTSTQGYAMSFFTPIILTMGMGFGRTATQLISVTPLLFGAVVMYAIGWIGDRWKLRGPLIIFNMVAAIIGLVLIGFHSTTGVRFFGVFLASAGVNSNLPTIMTYQANNIRGQWKRASASAVLVGMGGMGGIAGSLVFRTKDAPNFRPGLWACIACSLASIVLVLSLSIHFHFKNRQADRDGIILEDEEDAQVSPESRATFRFTY
ncbi:major facilitator superfamily domain-containing protein [Dactylonectria macrodidyma]|uniref:Major facilitator superfamily domain-containing protein n=1 Tax=Dactylonectria macrodidyma TaxID=307937 RepID=A0A9P9D257_9HYPO|nr:major facilitator superfamily domain-containing protein [Dactylonectria macrodidyma]